MLVVKPDGTAQDSVAALEAKVAKLEARLKDYPELQSAIQEKLTQARKELRDRLQEDFDFIASLKPTKQTEIQAREKRLQQLRERINQLNQQIAEQAPAAPTPTPVPAPAPAAPTPSPAPPPAPTPPAAPTAPTQPTPGPPPTQPAAPRAGAAPAQPQPQPEPQFSPNPLLPTSVKLVVDLSRDWSETADAKGCSNKPNAHDAGIWKVVLTARPETPTAKSQGIGFYADDANNVYIPFASIIRQTAALLVGSRTYVASAEKRVQDVRLVFELLTLAEAADLKTSV